MEHVVAVNPDGSGLESVGHLESSVEVASVDSSCKTVGSAVADTDCIFLGLELGDRADGSEDLLLHDLHLLVDVGEDRRLNEVTLITLTLATDLDLGSLLLTILDVSVRNYVSIFFSFSILV